MEKTFLQRILPFLNWLPETNSSSFKADLIAGITGAVIVLPQGVAFAMIAGMPPIYGLYTAMITPIIAALFGSSYHMVSGPTVAISIVVYSALQPLAEPGSMAFVELSLIVTFLAGCIQLMLGFAKMGTLVNFVSQAVIIGFTAGAGILIGISQLKHVIGADIPQGIPFYENLWLLIQNIPSTNIYVLIIGLATMISSILIKKFLPRWPHMLIAMLFGTLIGILINAEAKGVKLIGEMPAGLPSFEFPSLTAEKTRILFSNSFTIALLGLIQAVAIARAIGVKTGQRLNANQEFVGQGLSNIVGSFFSSYAGSGSFTRSAVNHQSGAKTPMSAILSAVILMLLVTFLIPYAAYIPIPAMGGIILIVAYNLIDVDYIKDVFRSSKSELVVLAVTFLATLLLELEYAIYFGVLTSLVLYLQRTSKPRIVEVGPEQDTDERRLRNVELFNAGQCPQLKMIRIDGSLFFGATDHVSSFFHSLENSKEKHLLLLCHGVNFIDLSGAEMLLEEAKRREGIGGGLYFCLLKKTSREFIEKSGFMAQIGEHNFFSSKTEAISKISSKFEMDICSGCTARVLKECP